VPKALLPDEYRNEGPGEQDGGGPNAASIAMYIMNGEPNRGYQESRTALSI
jgi:hypothetical protein